MVWAVIVVQTLGDKDEVWQSFGTGKSFQYLAVHKRASCLGAEKSSALPLFHSITGCDTSSAFVGHGKKSAWVAWNFLQELTDPLLRLACAPTEIPEHSIQAIKGFFIVMYERTSTYTDINKARKKLFAKKSCMQRIPPTGAALPGTACQEGCLPWWSYQGSHTYPTACASFSK